MFINIYIVDDEKPARDRLLYLINKFVNDEFSVVGQTGNPEDALEEIPKLSPDLLFLDVEMPQMTGLELAEKLQNIGYKGKIIFVTAYDQYTIKAIRANAFDYILKPVDVEELKKAIKRYKEVADHEFNPEAIKNFELSEREVELISFLAKGLSSEEIAEEMFLSKHTIDTHRRNILLKTGARNTIEMLNLFRY